MPESVYKVIELIGTSNESWEKAAANAVEQAAKSLRELRVAEVVELDMQLDAKGKVEAYRACCANLAAHRRSNLLSRSRGIELITTPGFR